MGRGPWSNGLPERRSSIHCCQTRAVALFHAVAHEVLGYLRANITYTKSRYPRPIGGAAAGFATSVQAFDLTHVYE
jgi:hypothetical protein